MPVAGQLAALARERRVLSFSGDLGSGKTTLIQHICRSLGVEEEVNSPSFGLVNEYDSPEGRICHFDLYRLRSVEEAMDIGFTEYIDSGDICLIEWPEIARDLLPDECLSVHLAHSGDGKRSIEW